MPARKSTAGTTTPKAAPKRRTARTTRKAPGVSDHVTIAERAYFIHLDEGSHDEFANWLRAERELAAA
jgi:hypothetical protein